MITLARTVQTCSACPSQWDAWDADGNYYYLRYRWGVGTVDDEREEVARFKTGDAYGGVMDLNEFCARAGLLIDEGAPTHNEGPAAGGGKFPRRGQCRALPGAQLPV